MALQGHYEEGIPLMQAAQDLAHAAGADIGRSTGLCQLAEAYIKAQRFDDALNALTEAFVAADKQDERYYDAEIYRLKGEVLLKNEESDIPEAQGCFERAIQIAREQSAKSLELRATTSLARLLASQGSRDEARTMLAAIYDWFTEGFDTTDLKDAKALLHELSN